ncbi:hypothetical protein BHM03_00005710 [Ensete ventricosum]|nr:hypothetical protein BHM03_00005710 [Ensete ventricosum]
MLVLYYADTAGNHGLNLSMQTISILFLQRFLFAPVLKLCFASSIMTLAENWMQAIDFLDKLLRYDHQDRLTAREAMVVFLNP